MNRKKWALVLLAGLCVALTLLNASWLAPAPAGELAVIAHRGTIQPEDPAPDGCPARHVRLLAHGYIENTLLSMQGAVAYGARGFALDVRTSADGHAMIFRDPTLECRTDGSGRVSQRPLAYLKGLDVGHGYTSDGGRAFPLRGRGVGAMPTAAEMIRAFPQRILIFKLKRPRMPMPSSPRSARPGGDRRPPRFRRHARGAGAAADAHASRLGDRPGGERGLPFLLSADRLDQPGAGQLPRRDPDPAA